MFLKVTVSIKISQNKPYAIAAEKFCVDFAGVL